jgi:hypothetical protein
MEIGSDGTAGAMCVGLQCPRYHQRVVQRHGAQGSAGPDPALLSGITFLQMFDQHTTVTIRYKLACAAVVCVRVCRLCVLPRCEALDLWSVPE